MNAVQFFRRGQAFLIGDDALASFEAIETAVWCGRLFVQRGVGVEN